VKPGERVITSGGDQIYPRGLPVGIVDRVVADTQNPPYLDIIIKPAANLGHLEELLVITQASDRMPEKEKQDLAQSAAEGAAVSQRRASDVLAERLPGLNDPNAVVDPNQDQKHSDAAAAAAAAAIPPKLHPPPTLHADHYSPDATPPANALTPGHAIVDPRYAPVPGAQPRVGATADSKPAKTAARSTEPNGDTAEQGASPGTAHPAAKPKTPKAPPTDQPAQAAPAPEPSTAPPASAGNGGPPQ
jgi:rod shape-determining protein MreC